MIEQSPFPVEPWALRETHLDLDLLAQSESLLALSNGHIGLRANLDEGEPHGIAGTYLNSFYEQRPLPYAERGYGYPESSQTVVNVTNGKLIRLLVDDEPFDVRYGRLHSHERVLDLKTGTLARDADWTSPAGKRVHVRSRRLVSFTHRSIAAIEYIVEPADEATRFIIQSELVANEAQAQVSRDPRVGSALVNPLESVEAHVEDNGALLLHRTRASKLLMGAGMDHLVDGPGRVEIEVDHRPDWARTNVISLIKPGEQLRVIKFLAYGWSSLRSLPAVRDQVAAALLGAKYTGFEGLLEEQRTYLDNFWDAADVEVEGDPEVQQAVRVALFHVLQAGTRAERRFIPAKGLTGPGYDGHAFWDTEAFILPLLTYTDPRAAAHALLWRHSTLDLAKERAKQLHLDGAAFPWRTIRGQECSGYWPGGTAGFHINADIAEAVTRYRTVTGDDELEKEGGLELLVETARLWISLGHHDRHGKWHIDGVTGPDEYSAVADDNVFTNSMAARNLRAAADAVDRNPEPAAGLDVTSDETKAWRAAADAVHIPYDDEIGVHEQSTGFTRHKPWDFNANKDAYPLLLHAPYFELYRSQVVKQADLVLAMHWDGDSFSPEDKARNFDYYERLTVRDSSLSACTQAVIAAELGHLELAHDYAYEAGHVDLRDLHNNTRDGLHIASLAGSWIALVAGFGGLRDHSGVLTFDPALPRAITRLRFAVRWHECRVGVDIGHESVTYTVRGGSESGLTIRHAGEELRLTPSEPAVRSLRARSPLFPAPEQPPGRKPPSRAEALADR
jgi:alpha,alpha-trehalose phosphorylase